MLGSGSAERVVAVCSVPMLFGSEILVREADIRLMWKTLTDVSSTFKTMSVREILDEETLYPLFGDRFEIRAFFENYLPEGASLVTVSAEFGEMRLILGEVKGEVRSIIGVQVE